MKSYYQLCRTFHFLSIKRKIQIIIKHIKRIHRDFRGFSYFHRPEHVIPLTQKSLFKYYMHLHVLHGHEMLVLSTHHTIKKKGRAPALPPNNSY